MDIGRPAALARAMISESIHKRARDLIEAAAAKGVRIATAESCTGGLIAAAMTAVPGSSAVFERGFVTYSNEAKAEMLGVPATLIAAHGAVSEAVARAMVEGAVAMSRADLAVAVTGVAGPDGGTAEKPVGLVHMALARRGGETEHVAHCFGAIGRHAVQEATVLAALAMLVGSIDG